MLRSISWGQYGTFLLISLVLIYTYLHRRFGLFQPWLGRLFKQAPPQTAPPPAPEPDKQAVQPEPYKQAPPPEHNGTTTKTPIQTSLFLVGLFAATSATAQNADGNAGINQANTLIRSYFATATQLMYAISAIIGLGGAIHVYVKMLRGHHDTQQAATAWFGACIFIAVVATVIQFFFGL
jgi:hypothetical protein